MELADDGDLYHRIQKMATQGGQFQENEVWKVVI
jgi:hypothetical protein